MGDYKQVDENLIQITEYDVLGKLPDPFLFDDGTPVKTAEDWKKRRGELYKTAVELQFGTPPPQPEFLDVMMTGKTAKVDNYTIITGTREKPVRFTMMLFKPKGPGPFPTVVYGDLCFQCVYNKDFINAFTDNGIMLALFNRTDLVPDRQDIGRTGPLYETYPDGKFGAVAAWAWGYSRCVDALEKIGLADMSCIAFTGQSRGGKTAILAGALDERAAIVNPNETCAAGCGCYRVHISAVDENGKTARSETLKDIFNTFPLWFNPELGQYTDKEGELPFDSHFLKAMVAPRTLFVSEAGSDIWANPVGSWQTTMAAKEVFKFLDAEDKLFWYFRNGYHTHDMQDVEMLVNVILHQYKGQPLNDHFFRTPFKPLEPIYDWRCPENS